MAKCLDPGESVRAELGVPAGSRHGRRRRQALLLIGNNQAENPWLEESLATFGDGIAGGDAIDYRNRDISRCVVSLLGATDDLLGGQRRFRPLHRGRLQPGCCLLLQAQR